MCHLLLYPGPSPCTLSSPFTPPFRPKVVTDEMLHVGADVLCGTRFAGPKMRWMCEDVRLVGAWVRAVNIGIEVLAGGGAGALLVFMGMGVRNR